MTDPQRFALTDASLRLDTMPAAGRDVRLKGNPEERLRLAEILDVSEVESLDVVLNAVRFRGGMRVTGHLDAVIVQPSVVSLQPVRQAISEEVDRIFLPGEEKSFASQADAEIFVDPDGDDLPDHFDGTEADLTDLIVETLSLAIDPYPRLEGENAEDVLPPDDGGKESPFAALKALKLDNKG